MKSENRVPQGYVKGTKDWDDQYNMLLDDGLTCTNCVKVDKCCRLFGSNPTDTRCQWFPNRFELSKGMVYLGRLTDWGTVERYNIVSVGKDSDGAYFIVDDEDNTKVYFNDNSIIGKEVFFTEAEARAHIERNRPISRDELYQLIEELKERNSDYRIELYYKGQNVACIYQTGDLDSINIEERDGYLLVYTDEFGLLVDNAEEMSI